MWHESRPKRLAHRRRLMRRLAAKRRRFRESQFDRINRLLGKMRSQGSEPEFESISDEEMDRLFVPISDEEMDKLFVQMTDEDLEPLGQTPNSILTLRRASLSGALATPRTKSLRSKARAMEHRRPKI